MKYEEIRDYLKEKSGKYGFAFVQYPKCIEGFLVRLTKDTIIHCDERFFQVYGVVSCTKSPQSETTIPLKEIGMIEFSILPPSIKIITVNNIWVSVDAACKSNFKYNFDIDLKDLPYLPDFTLKNVIQNETD